MKRASRGTRVRVPSRVRDMLHPYAEIFENVVIPMAAGTKGNTGKSILEVRRAIDQYQKRKFRRLLHPALVCHGLLLCCHYCSVPRQRFSKHATPKYILQTVSRATVLVRRTYEHYRLQDDLLSAL